MSKLKKIVFSALVALIAVPAASVLAADASFTGTKIIGNDASSRPVTDTRANFSIVDTNNPASRDGRIREFSYYASDSKPFRFFVVDSSKKVKWVSNEITPSAAPGSNTYNLPSAVNVESGDNIGLYFPSTGAVPFESSGASASYTYAGSGIPSTGSTLSFEGSANRKYSFAAYGREDEDRPGRGNRFPGFAYGRISYNAAGLDRTASFYITARDNRNSQNSGTGTFIYRDANRGWYMVNIRYAAVSGKNAFFAGRVVSASNSEWRGQWLYGKVLDNGRNGDQIWGSFVTESEAKAMFSQNQMQNPSSGPFSASKGNISVMRSWR